MGTLAVTTLIHSRISLLAVEECASSRLYVYYDQAHLLLRLSAQEICRYNYF